jgi:hypothetical protein
MWRLKSMQKIFLADKLPPHLKAVLIEHIKQKGALLIQGYLKHGNQEAVINVENILKKLIL